MNTILITTSTFGISDSSPVEWLRQHGYEIISNPYNRKLTEQEVLELIVRYNPVGMIAGTEPITPLVLEAAKQLRVISRCGVGIDNIDLGKAHEQGIMILCTPDAPAPAVKELAIAFMFNGLRKICLSDRSIRHQGWERKQGKLLANQTVGIVGLGRIGSLVAEFLTKYGCRVLGYDLKQTYMTGVEYVSLDRIYSESDIISLHVPNQPDTYKMINKYALERMKSDVLIINTSRGELVDEEALFDFLQRHSYAHACLDTYEHEPYLGSLAELENVTLTPHIGSFAVETRLNMEHDAVANLVEYLNRR